MQIKLVKFYDHTCKLAMWLYSYVYTIWPEMSVNTSSDSHIK